MYACLEKPINCRAKILCFRDAFPRGKHDMYNVARTLSVTAWTWWLIHLIKLGSSHIADPESSLTHRRDTEPIKFPGQLTSWVTPVEVKDHKRPPFSSWEQTGASELTTRTVALLRNPWTPSNSPKHAMVTSLAARRRNDAGEVLVSEITSKPKKNVHSMNYVSYRKHQLIML